MDANGMPDQNSHSPAAPRMDPALWQAYVATHFHIDSEPPFLLRIGVLSPDFGAWLGRAGHARATLITAWNPFSRPLKSQENNLRQRELLEEVKALKLLWLRGRGCDPRGDWKEESLCVFDADSAQIDAWMRRYAQNAVVQADTRGEVRLLLHPDLRDEVCATQFT